MLEEVIVHCLIKKIGILANYVQEEIASTDEMDLLERIIKLNQNRILCRLKSKHAILKCRNKKAKIERPKVIPTVAQAVATVTSRAIGGSSSEELQQASENGREMNRLFEKLESFTKVEAASDMGARVLFDIVLSSHRLCVSRMLPRLLLIARFEDEQKSSICRIIQKLGRYRSACLFLVQAAARFSIFKSIKVSVVKMSPSPLNLVEEPPTFVNGIINGLFSGHEVNSAISRLQSRLGKKKFRYDSFCTSVFTMKYVVHAELQLLFHYELQSCTFPPRVICSGKMACFLCNMFLKEHGRYFIPSTHGRVYEKWILPSSLGGLQGTKARDMLSVVEKFHAALDGVLRREILTPSKTIPQPNESHMIHSAIWSEAPEPSLRSIQRIDSGYDDGEKDIAASSSTTIRSRAQSEAPVDVETAAGSSTVRSIQSQSSSVEAKIPYIMLTKEKETSLALSPSCRVIKVSTPRMHLTFSYQAWEQSLASLSVTEISDEAVGCRLQFTWLKDYKSLGPGPKMIDLDEAAENLQETFDQLAGSCDFCVKKGKDIVSVQTTYS